jgi:hypothetical protein
MSIVPHGNRYLFCIIRRFIEAVLDHPPLS